jgi:hypothetical protein
VVYKQSLWDLDWIRSLFLRIYKSQSYKTRIGIRCPGFTVGGQGINDHVAFAAFFFPPENSCSDARA